MQTRRSFLCGATGAALASVPFASSGRPRRPGPEEEDVPGAAEPAAKPLRILILGGTGFLGPPTVRHALDRGHTLTIFNRGRTNTHLFPEVEKLRGDRKDDLASLRGREWDVVIDNSGYVPRHVRMSAELLAGSVGLYVFTSTMSVYADMKEVGIDEEYAVGVLEDETVEQVTGETYGPLKALCEQAAGSAFPEGCCVVRPGLIVGPGDWTDRFTYWPVRVSAGGEVLAPGEPADPTSFIDVRDLAAWLVSLSEAHTTGVFNAVGPTEDVATLGTLLEACKRVSESDARFVWADAEFLSEQGVAAWSDMPVWVPPIGEYAGFGRTSRARAFAHGLACRPMEDTIRDTLAWHETERPEGYVLKAGLTPEREASVLAAWHAAREEG